MLPLVTMLLLDSCSPLRALVFRQVLAIAVGTAALGAPARLAAALGAVLLLSSWRRVVGALHHRAVGADGLVALAAGVAGTANVAALGADAAVADGLGADAGGAHFAAAPRAGRVGPSHHLFVS